MRPSGRREIEADCEPVPPRLRGQGKWRDEPAGRRAARLRRRALPSGCSGIAVRQSGPHLDPGIVRRLRPDPRRRGGSRAPPASIARNRFVRSAHVGGRPRGHRERRPCLRGRRPRSRCRGRSPWSNRAHRRTGRRGGGAADHAVPRMARPSLRRGPLGPRDDRPRGRRRRPRSTRREVPPNLVQ